MTRSKCYACDEPTVGTRRATWLELACKQHAGPTSAEIEERQREVAEWHAVWGVGTVPP